MPERRASVQSASVPIEVQAAAESLLGPIESMTPLAGIAAGGGSGGQSFHVIVAGRQLHLKQVAPASLRLLSLEDEYDLLRQLAAGQLAPAPVAADAARGLIACEFVADSVPLTAAELREPANLGALAKMLRQLHRSPSRLPAHSARAIAERYLAAVGPGLAAEPVERERARELLAAADAFDRLALPSVLCHGDIVAANVLRVAPRHAGVDDVALRLIDFEYARSAPAVLDLATVSVMNELEPADDERLLELYHGGRGQPFSPGDFATVRRLVALTAHFWAIAAASDLPAAASYRLGIDEKKEN